ncbi:hypothetical protein H9P43_010098 [Blastocladiella emersonii ATCC 22665]|nr:hypothetical protein H9P43_010098 [Blastocladiella emersonii ATCC 22665]
MLAHAAALAAEASRFLSRWLVRGALVYLAAVALLAAFPRLQALLVYMHWVNWPLGDLATPTVFGFRDGSVRNIRIPTTDGLHIGAWHIVQESPRARRENGASQFPRDSTATESPGALLKWRIQPADAVFLYLHGNAGNRAVSHRRAFYQSLLASHMRASRRRDSSSGTGDDAGRAHLLAFDYRGFGDSARALPSELGVRQDALAAWNYLLEQGARPGQIVIIGHSLGTGIATALAAHLAESDPTAPPPRGLMLLAPFTSIPDAALQYPLVPLHLIGMFTGGHAGIQDWVKSKISVRLNSAAALPLVSCPILLVHGALDAVVRIDHSRALFKALTGRSTRNALNLDLDSLSTEATTPLHITPVGELEGTVYSAVARPRSAKADSATTHAPRSVTFAEVAFGGHDDLQVHAMVRDMMAVWLRGLSEP